MLKTFNKVKSKAEAFVSFLLYRPMIAD